MPVLYSCCAHSCDYTMRYRHHGFRRWSENPSNKRQSKATPMWRPVVVSVAADARTARGGGVLNVRPGSRRQDYQTRARTHYSYPGVRRRSVCHVQSADWPARRYINININTNTNINTTSKNTKDTIVSSRKMNATAQGPMSPL